MTLVDGECAGKVALVTGASRGIGAAIAQRLASAGAAVAAVARSLDSHPPNVPGTLRDTVAAIETCGGRAVAIQGDILDAQSRIQVVARCQEEIGPVDILVNNAASIVYHPFEQFSPLDLRLIYEANVHAPFALCQLVAAGMRAQRQGWIVNISSITAEHPQGPPFSEWDQVGGHMVYGSSKAALNRLTTGLAAELYRDGIAVNALAPVVGVRTPGMEATGSTDWIKPWMIEPVEVMAEAALALGSCDPATMTGRVVYSRTLLEELGRPVRTLDGRMLFPEPAPPRA